MVWWCMDCYGVGRKEGLNLGRTWGGGGGDGWVW